MIVDLMDEEYKKQKKALLEKLKKVQKESGSKIAESAVKEEEGYLDDKKKDICKLARMVFEEGLSMYEEGEMTFDEFVEDISKTLKVIK